MRSYIDCMLRYFEFSGRSTRMQYWMFGVVSFLICLVAFAFDLWTAGPPFDGNSWGAMTVFACVIHVIPGITVTVRRLHDIGRSGWWYWIGLVPLIGSLILLVFMCWPSDDYGNDYGDHPRDGERRPAPRLQPRHSTIPRQVRMGSNASRPPAVGQNGPAAGRFI